MVFFTIIYNMNNKYTSVNFKRYTNNNNNAVTFNFENLKFFSFLIN